MDPQTLFPGWNALEPKQKKLLFDQIQTFDLQIIEKQRSLLLNEKPTLDSLSVFERYENNGHLSNIEIGKKMIQDGKVGCLIVAGGQGSRLQYKEPKGFYPVTIIRKKSLFQLFAEKILAAGAQVGRPLYVAIMTSLQNHESTLDIFKKNNLFGLSPDQLFFFSQKELPLLNANGNLFLESACRFSMGPDGNASALKQFVSSGIWDNWNEKGISYINYLHIDNPLADPFDAEMTGFHKKNSSSDIIIKCIFKKNPQENLGVLFEQKGKVFVLEYSEISAKDREEKNENGSLKNKCANIGLYSFKMDFIKEVALDIYDKLPFHKAWKAAKHFLKDGSSTTSQQPIAWKFEKFIFDVFPFARDVKALSCPRSECFTPLKNAEGEDSLLAVQNALQKRDHDIFEKISGKRAIKTPFELDPSFYYPTSELLKKWQGRDLPDTSYIFP